LAKIPAPALTPGLQAGAQNPSGLEAVSTAFIWALHARKPLKRLLRICIENTGMKPVLMKWNFGVRRGETPVNFQSCIDSTHCGFILVAPRAFIKTSICL
jgi:hypothetical protein